MQPDGKRLFTSSSSSLRENAAVWEKEMYSTLGNFAGEPARRCNAKSNGHDTSSLRLQVKSVHHGSSFRSESKYANAPLAYLHEPPYVRVAGGCAARKRRGRKSSEPKECLRNRDVPVAKRQSRGKKRWKLVHRRATVPVARTIDLG